MTSAFLESEQALANTDSAVSVAQQLDPGSHLRQSWTALRERYAQVTAEYLRLSAATQSDDERAARSGPQPRPDEYARCTQALTAMTAEINQFAQSNDRELTRARHTLNETGVLENRARVSATQAATALENTPANLVELGTVSQAAAGLSAAASTFETADGLVARRNAATAVLAAADRVQAALTEAPQFAERADRIIRSVETRRSALHNQSDQIPSMLSALRREFSSECSADLVGVESRIQAHFGAADEHLASARADRSRAPDYAITEAAAAREDLDAAAVHIETVGDRLRELRDVAADPAATEQRVRFRLRDAQHFAVNNTLVDEWGSVLDAQADRISRARAVLDRVHPDYWSYLTQLRAVDQRIGEIVDRMRGQVAAR